MLNAHIELRMEYNNQAVLNQIMKLGEACVAKGFVSGIEKEELNCCMQLSF